MKEKYKFILLVIVACALSVVIYYFTYNEKEKIVNRDRLDTITLEVNESIEIELGDKKYTLKLLEIWEMTPCSELPPTDPNQIYMPSFCAPSKTLQTLFSINNVQLYLDSGFNYSSWIRSTDFITDYVIYYIPEFSETEATFLIENDPNYKKERNLIIGDYVVYVDENNKIIDINTFSREIQTWGLRYAGRDLKEITKKINEGIDLRK